MRPCRWRERRYEHELRRGRRADDPRPRNDPLGGIVFEAAGATLHGMGKIGQVWVMDIVDQAQALEQRERNKGVARIQAGLNVEGAADCSDCADEIPMDRRKAMPNATRCAPCQEKHERKGRR